MKKIYIETDMREMPNEKNRCSYLIKAWDKELKKFVEKCGLAMPLFCESVDCCSENCPLVEIE